MYCKIDKVENCSNSFLKNFLIKLAVHFLAKVIVGTQKRTYNIKHTH